MGLFVATSFAGFSLQTVAAELRLVPVRFSAGVKPCSANPRFRIFRILRVERAQSLLHGTGLNVEAIAAEVGYEDGATLRTLICERLGRCVHELRANLL